MSQPILVVMGNHQNKKKMKLEQEELIELEKKVNGLNTVTKEVKMDECFNSMKEAIKYFIGEHDFESFTPTVDKRENNISIISSMLRI